MFSYGIAILFGFMLGFFAENIDLCSIEVSLVLFLVVILITLMSDDINTRCRRFFKRIFSL